MRNLLIGLVFLGIAVVSYCYIDKKQEQVKTDFSLPKKAYDYRLEFNKLNSLLANAKTLEDLDKIKFASLNKDDQAKLESYIVLKRASLLFNEGEYYLRRASEIQNAITVPPPPKVPTPHVPPPTDEGSDMVETPEEIAAPTDLHPLTTQMLNKAKEYYEAARKEVDKLSENDSVNFNYDLNYLKGEIYYRHLEFMSNQDNAQELFNQTLNHFKFALRYKQEIETVVNIELLIKDKDNLLGGASNPDVKKKQMLNIRSGLGNSRGN